MSTDELAGLRQEIAELRGDFREAVARIDGAVSNMSTSKDLVHEAIRNEVKNTEYDLRTTKQALTNVQDHVGRFPKPEWYEGMTKSMSTLEDKITEAVALQAETLAGHGNTLQRHSEILDEQRDAHEDVHVRLGTVERKLDRVGFFILGAATAGGGAGAALARWLIGG